jgi:hypothetical protein
MGSRHPWEITLREFLEQTRRSYGIEIDPSIFGKILVHQREGRPYILPKLEWDETLTPTVLRALCRFFNLPPEDFALDSNEDD